MSTSARGKRSGSGEQPRATKRDAGARPAESARKMAASTPATRRATGAEPASGAKPTAKPAAPAPASRRPAPTPRREGEPLRAAVLAIGDEVLTGEIPNSNATFIAERLFDAGFALREHVVISDDAPEIEGVLARLRDEVDVVVATGGLGPTEDDRTVDVVCHLLGVDAEAHAPSLDLMKTRFSAHGFELTPNNLRQVRVPRGADALANIAGIAPGFRIALGRADAFFLPGVPREMERIFADHVQPRLAKVLTGAGVPAPAVRTWHTYGMGESHIDHRLQGLLDGIEGATLHFRTAPPENHVKVIVRGPDAAASRALLDRIDAELRKRIGNGIYGTDDETFALVVGRVLRAAGAKLALAESCTGGLAGDMITTEPGASDFFAGGVVAYDNAVKVNVLGVKQETIDAHGAVSEPCAREMAEGAKRLANATVAVAITGIAGSDRDGRASAPPPVSMDKPVGTVCFAVAGPKSTKSTTKLFSGGRDRIRRAAAFFALDLARRQLA